MARLGSIHFAFALTVFACATAPADAPKITRTEPADGATGVPVGVGVVRVLFDQDMRTNSFTCWKSPQGVFPPPVKENSTIWRDARTFELRLAALMPDTTYYIQLNTDGRQGFRSVAGEPLEVTTIHFTTAQKAATPRQDVYDPSATPAPRQEIHDPSAGTKNQPRSKAPTSPASVPLKWDARVGQRSRMSRISRVKIELTFTTGEGQFTQTIDQLFKLKHIEEVLDVEDGRPARVRWQVELAEMMQRDTNTGETVRSELPLKGLDVVLSISPTGAVGLVDVRQGQREAAQELASESYWFSLVPGQPAAVGESWALAGAQLQTVLTALEATEGEVRMALVSVEQDPQIRLDVAKLEGTLNGKMPLPIGIAADVDGTFAVDFVPAMGLPFLRRLSANLRVEGEVNDGVQQFRVKGAGTLEAVEERSLLNNAPGTGTADEQRPVRPGPGAIRVPDTGKKTSTSSQGGHGAKANDERGFHLMLHREGYQGAFHMLIPKGWKTEGGMIPSGVEWNVVDLVENNIRFRATSPDEKSFLGFYPRFYFMDPASIAQSSSGYLQYSPGQVHNGTWVYPYMTLQEYVEQIVFAQFASQEFIDPRIIETVEVPELRKLAPPMAGQPQAGYVEFECVVRSVPSRGRIYSVLYNLGGGQWSTVGTWGLVSPVERWQTDQRLMETCLKTFRLDPQWVTKASAAANYRATKYNRINREVNAAYDQMQKQRMQTNSDINTETYKVLTEQIETRDPETGRVTWHPMYERAFTNGRGDYFLTDYQGHLPIQDNPEWRKLEIINRNELRP